MYKHKYLIVGGGMAAGAAVSGIREVDPRGDIGLISADSDPPYKRPPLSKGLWKGESVDTIWEDVNREGVDLHLNRSVSRLLAHQKQLIDNKGIVYEYDKLLIANGGNPRRLPFGGDDIIYFRSLADYRRLRELTDHGRRRFGVIGGGFIGWEIAAALAMNGKEVVMLFPEAYIGHRLYPRDLGLSLNAFYREKGVAVFPETTVTGLSRRGQELVLQAHTADGQAREFAVDGVVGGIGITPNTELANAAGLTTDNGIVVDQFLRTSDPDVFAAGDVASFLNPILGKRLRLEHEDNANAMGRHAGRAMAGALEPYEYLPFFYSDLFELGFEAVGELNSRLRTIAEWVDPFREGVVAYLEGDRIRGLILWNVWEKVDAARDLIAQNANLSNAEVSGRLQSLFPQRRTA
ncbi:MAG: NAD(P)/FAD-dependent oxidoreductase [Chloroflexota bacterium]